MRVKFYYNQSDDRTINKILIPGDEYEGVPRDEISIMQPIVRFDRAEVLRYNYAYISEFQRYYSISDKTSYREGIWDIAFSVDVLMSFRNDIINLVAVVDKQSDRVIGNEYIDDYSLVTENKMFKNIYNFPNGFNDEGEYILITAG